jgi:predicted enzyme related to lactoylglutathione lyase
MSSHPIVHVEIPASDTKAGGKFYGEVFGWKIETDPTFDYTMFQVEGGPGGGFTSTSDSSPMKSKPGDVLVYIGTDDIDASLRQVEAHGGKVVMPKTEIPNTGWFSIFTDPTGNRIGLFTSLPRR